MSDAVARQLSSEKGQFRPGPWLLSAAIAVGGGLVVGDLTSIGQTVLPDEVRSLANGSAPWSAAAFVLAAVAGRRDALRSAILALGALLSTLVGYDLTAALRGFPVSTSMTLFWVVAAVIGGPILGVGAAWSQGSDRPKAAAGMALLASILVGEAIYGLTVVRDSTSPVYWTAQLLVGLGLVLVLAIHVKSVIVFALCAVLTAAGAAAFYLLYSNI